MLIPGYPEGSDITILDTSYIGRRKDENGKVTKDYISILFKDNTTGEKHIHIIYEPEYTYYKLDKAKYNVEHHLFFIEKEKTIPVTTKYSQLLKDIAEKTGNLEFFYDNIRSGNSGENRKLHTLNDIFMSDLNIEDYYRMLFAREYKNEACKLNKAYLDIEVDGKNQMGDFPEPDDSPINAVVILDDQSNTVYQFLLEDQSNPLIEQYKEFLKQPGTIDQIKQFVIQKVGGKKKAKKFGVDTLDFKFLFFKDEITLIQSMFEVLHQLNPDVLMIWNMAFDLNFIINRIEYLGYDPKDIICDPRIKEKFLKFYVDQRNQNEFAERGDFVDVSMFTVWLDDMIQFASRRKGRGQYPSFKLDDIGQAISGVKKLDYSDITTNIMMLPYLNYRIFSWYNIMDVVVQKCIEMKAMDADYIFTKCLINNTKYAKGHRQSVYLANRFTKEFYDYGYIIGNNINKWNEKPETKYPGAQVGDPMHNSTYAVIEINGRPTLVALNVVDYDYKSLYPSITLENNMAPNTQVGRYELNEQISYNEHPTMYSSEEETFNYSRAGEFMENMISGNHLEFCKRWLHLGDFKEVVSDMREYFTTIKRPEVPIDLEPTDLVYFGRDDNIDLIKYQDQSYSSSVNNIVSFYNNFNASKEELISNIGKKAFV